MMSLIAFAHFRSYFHLFSLVSTNIPMLSPPVVHHLLQIAPNCALHFVYLFLLVCLHGDHIFSYLKILQDSLLFATLSNSQQTCNNTTPIYNLCSPSSCAPPTVYPWPVRHPHPVRQFHFMCLHNLPLLQNFCCLYKPFL